ncbi:MAG: class I SAM-dependent methyltransferase [Candidatus Paceibacterota bacterium]
METCIACGSQNILKESQIEGYVQGAFYFICSCFSCGTKWSSPHTEESSVYNLIYSEKDTPGYMRYNEYAEEILYSSNPLRFLKFKEEMYYSVVKSIDKNITKNGNILDVGCGLGYMTYALVKGGYKATGLDISSNAIEKATSRYGDYFVCENFFSFKGIGGGYDAICMLELIEHVHDPKKYIEHAMTLLSPEGILILTTPNRSWHPDKTLWGTDLPPVHLTWFSEKGISSFAEMLGLKASFFSFGFYNIFFGTLLKPEIPNLSVRTSFFTKNGDVLYPRYVKSKLRILTEKFHMYVFLKMILHMIKKVREFLNILFSNSSLCLRKSNIICVTMCRQ